MSKRGIELRAQATKRLPFSSSAPRTGRAKSEPAPAPRKKTREYNLRDLSNMPRVTTNQEMMRYLVNAINTSGKSVSQLEDETGITGSNIYAILRGKRKWCQSATFIVLLEMCGKPVPWK